MNKQTIILDAVRSPIGLKNGKLIGIRPDDLSAKVLKVLLERNSTIDHKYIEDVVIGCAFPEGSQGFLMARGVSIMAGLPKETGGKVVNRLCGLFARAFCIICSEPGIFLNAGVSVTPA